MELSASFISWTTWTLKWAVYFSLALATGFISLLYFNQNKMIYAADFPEGARTNIPKPNEHGMDDWEDVTLTASDGVKLKGYFIRHRAQPNAPLANSTLLYFHANAGNMGHRLPISNVLKMALGCNVFMLSYRGYGASEGSANEQGMKLDAQAALDYLTSHSSLKNSKILVYGQSIGGAVSVDLAAKNQGKIDALVLENTFLGLRKLMPHVLPVLSRLTFLCNQIWDSESAIATIDLPILFLSGEIDQLVPPSHMKKLHEIAKKSSSKLIRFKSFPKGSHNDTVSQPEYFETIRSFWYDVDKGKLNK
ncbi:Alpha/Beta hydrolase protein [Globomyces pollinis-pini]|nr:Alpha/Beta hydrolase protein [Globomyces pollinis-pini]